MQFRLPTTHLFTCIRINNVNNMVVCYHYEIIDHMIYLYNLYSLCSGNNLLPTECVFNAFNKYMLSEVSRGRVEIHLVLTVEVYFLPCSGPIF